MTRRTLRFVILLAGFVIFMAAPSFVRLYTDWLWFGELGYQFVLATMLRSQGTLFTIVFVSMLVWLSLNLRVAVASLSDSRPSYTTPEGFHIALPGRRQFTTIANVVAALIALLAGLYAAGEWNIWMAWRNAVPFGEADPLLGRDVSFYVFTLPFLQLVRSLLQLAIVTAAIASGAIYFISGSLVSAFPVTTLSLSGPARRHLALLGAAFLLVLAFGAWMQQAEYLVPATNTAGAMYTDVHARMPASLVLMAVCIVGAGLAVLQALTDRRWPIPAAIGLYLLVSFGGGIYASLLQRIAVSPNEQARETPYIRNNIQATRRAFALDTVEKRQISGEARLSRADIDRNTATLQNVRLWDHQPLLQTFSQLQEIRTYYDFASIDNDRYVINGALRQVMLSGREVNSESLPNRTWVNERLTFTHGYGLTLGPVNQVTSQGLPVLFIRDMPPVTTAGLNVDEPSIYFGERSNDYVIVRTNAREFHYPRENGDVDTRYEGSGGVPIGSLGRQILFALRFASYDIILSDAVTSESRILFNRRIADRLQALAGDFLEFDQDPYLALVDGRLYWLCDAYTTSGRYPYSTRSTATAGRINYIRNSVKFVIDAYNGTTTAYLSDDKDPIAATYARIFPTLFKPMSAMPAGLRAHVRYPEDIFAVQSRMYATFHMTDPATFYKREDQWEIPVIEETPDGGGTAMQPYYTIMRLPGERDPEFIQMLPFTPRSKDNLAAWLVARSDGDQYGRLGVFEFPKQSLIYGPKQIVGRINQDQTISPQITLWNQQGSQVIWGTMMVIPIEESLIYVRPLYLRAQGGRIPELTRVIVAYEDRIVMEPTLEASIARLFGGQAPAPPSIPEEGERTTAAPPSAPPPGTPAPAAAGTRELTADARAHYDRAIAAQRAGDWAKYGEEIRLLGEVLERMKLSR
jgi:uncharacterized membrane protein (UPF0182 family)